MPVRARKILPGALRPIAIFAPGLIGGSLGMALRRRAQAPVLRIWARRDEAALEASEALGAEVGTTDPAEAVRGAGVVVLCAPVGALPGLAQAIRPHLETDAVVTDAGSIKALVVGQLDPILGTRFCGAHPMAGSEKNGLAAARADLFDGAGCILTPGPSTAPETTAAVRALWESAGCRVVELAADEHDRILAAVSHLPHLLAACLVASVCGRNPDWQKLAGSGYRDTTRIAAGEPGMWTEILEGNRREVLQSMKHLTQALEEARCLLEAGHSTGLLRFLAQAKVQREAFGGGNSGKP